MTYKIYAGGLLQLSIPPLFGFQGANLNHRCNWQQAIYIVGVFSGEGPPVPIPNTEVKLTSADNTCLETDREDRSMPTQGIRSGESLAYASLAQR